MLIRFSFKNCLSFSSLEDGGSKEFSMIAGETGNKRNHVYGDDRIQLLKFSAIYGANASGKSNFVGVVEFFQKTVTDKLPIGHTSKYCRVNPENREKESYFEIEIILNGRYYAYGFEVILSLSKFVSEWLIELTSDDDEKIIFSRDIENGEYAFGESLKNEALLKRLDIYAEDIKNDDSILFLSLMNKNKKNLYEENTEALIIKNVYEWIKECLNINYPDKPISNCSYMAKTENIDEICKIISAFGTGITNFKLNEVPPDKLVNYFPPELLEDIFSQLEKKISASKNSLHDKTNSQNLSVTIRSNKDFFVIGIDENGKITCKTAQFFHGEDNILFDLSEESDGTVRILDLIEILILKNENKTYIIDELDRCLHPSLSYKFVETFLELAEKKNVQLIVTTHESRLMDFDLLRRDEIWFVNKNENGESEIYSLEEYNTRFDQKIDKAYLEGRYGGIPIFSAIFPIKEE